MHWRVRRLYQKYRFRQFDGCCNVSSRSFHIFRSMLKRVFKRNSSRNDAEKRVDSVFVDNITISLH